MDKFELLNAFISAVLNKTPDEWGEPRTYGGLEVVEILWPLNDFFRPQLIENIDCPYLTEYEPDADEAIIAFVMDGSAAWEVLPVNVWRVLVERHIQALMVASVNELSNPNFFTLPKDLPKQALLLAAMIFLMYQMKLPYPVKPLSVGAIPPADMLAAKWLH